MKETISVNIDTATITYDLLNDTKAASVYKKIRNLTESLNECRDYAGFHLFVKKLKPNEAYEIVEVSLWTPFGFYVRIGHMQVIEENSEEFESDDLEAAG